MTIYLVDVSHHDRARRGRALDWAAIRRHTSEAMIARATYGDPSGFSPDTRYFDEFQVGAKAAGFTLRGGYHNLVKGDAASISRQVDWFLRELDSHDCAWAMLDIERYPELVTNNLWPRWADVLRFRDRWAQVADGRVLAYYLPQWLWSGHLGSPDLRALGGPLISSNYGSNLDGLPPAIYGARGGDSGAGWKPYGGVTPSIWQFGSDCDLPGASNKTDINAFRGSIDELRTLLTGADDMLTKTEAGHLIALAYRLLALAKLDESLAAAEQIPADGRITDVPLIDLLKRVDANAAAAATGSVDPAALAEELLRQSGGHVTVTIPDEQLAARPPRRPRRPRRRHPRDHVTWTLRPLLEAGMGSKVSMRNLTLGIFVLVWAVTQVVSAWEHGAQLDEKSLGMLLGGITAIVLAFRSDRNSDSDSGERGGDST